MELVPTDMSDEDKEEKTSRVVRTTNFKDVETKVVPAKILKRKIRRDTILQRRAKGYRCRPGITVFQGGHTLRLGYTTEVYPNIDPPLYDENGIHLATGKDLCDCGVVSCIGCYMICRNCKGKKCNVECRCDRDVEAEDLLYEGYGYEPITPQDAINDREEQEAPNKDQSASTEKDAANKSGESSKMGEGSFKMGQHIFKKRRAPTKLGDSAIEMFLEPPPPIMCSSNMGDHFKIRRASTNLGDSSFEMVMGPEALATAKTMGPSNPQNLWWKVFDISDDTSNRIEEFPKIYYGPAVDKDASKMIEAGKMGEDSSQKLEDRSEKVEGPSNKEDASKEGDSPKFEEVSPMKIEDSSKKDQGSTKQDKDASGKIDEEEDAFNKKEDALNKEEGGFSKEEVAFNKEEVAANKKKVAFYKKQVAPNM